MFAVPKVAEVEGHADEGMVADGRAREIDRVGDNEADAAADMGRRRLHCSITDARRYVNGGCARWYPIVSDLHHLFIAIARTLGEDDHGDTSLHPVVRSNAATPKMRRVDRAVRNFAWLPGLASHWTSEWFRVPGVGITAADVGVWHFSVGHMVQVSAFCGNLHWAIGAGDFGCGGVSYLELLNMHERWAGERLVFGKRSTYYLACWTPNFSVGCVPVGPGIDIWRTRFLNGLPGGMARFVPCGSGANHCRLQHVGWEKCG